MDGGIASSGGRRASAADPPPVLYLDCETYNTRDIKVGTYAYSETAEILLIAYAENDGEVRVYDAAAPGAPGELRRFKDAVARAGELVAHNAMFDRTVLGRHFPEMRDPARWRCTMVGALSHSLPGALAAAGAALGLKEGDAKQAADGKRLINRFCKPAPSNHKADRYNRGTHPDEWARFVEYARRDVVAMREVDRRLPKWNAEWPLWRLDQRVNDRGFRVDAALVAAGAAEAARESVALRAEFQALTGGAVMSLTQRVKLKAYLADEYLLELPDTKAETVTRFLDHGVNHPTLRRILELMVQGNKTSTAKYKALAPATSADGRFRGGLQFSGAGRTSRWGGRVFQPHNLPSRDLPPKETTAQYIEDLIAGADLSGYENPMKQASAALRGVLIAPPGRKLAVADLSAIEGRVAAWLAGETWKLDAFAAFDADPRPKDQKRELDLYVVTAARMLAKRPEDIADAERSLGKVAELALGYAGGVGALQNFAKGKMAALTPILDPGELRRAAENYAAWGRDRDKGETAPGEWVASEAVKLTWRGRHPRLRGLWRACADAARAALQSPGTAVRAGPRLAFRAGARAGTGYLLCRLPSGRMLTYVGPRMGEDGSISYMGVDPERKTWVRQRTYGGKLVENACQAVARDVLAASMAPAEAAGFEIVLTVHDEIVAETTNGTGEGLARIMAAPPPWADGLPLNAEGETLQRYRK